MLPPLNYLDRYCNEGTRTYSSHAEYTEAKPQFRPHSEQPNFEITPYAIDNRHVNIYTANPSAELANHYIHDDQVTFCIHPQVLDGITTDPYIHFIKSEGIPLQPFQVAPSSSTRTLNVLGKQPSHALKVHFPFKISRYGRKMRDEVIEQAVNVSQELEKGVDKMSSRFAFLREVIGVSFKDQQPTSLRNENWGFLVRDMRPFPFVNEARTLLPGFALYGRDYFTPDKPVLLMSLIGKNDPLEYILNNIMLPIIHQWIDCFQSFGYLLEPHGQNVLFELNSSNAITRIVHRDLSVGIDTRLREQKNISLKKLNHYNQMRTGSFHSITYDMFMGHHFFERIVECCCSHFPELTPEDFRAPCRKTFADHLPDYSDFFPETVQYFGEKRDQYNKPLYKDTGKKPLWRP